MPLALLAVALVVGVIAFAMYPRTPAVTVQGAVQRITVVGPLQPADLDVNEAGDGHGGIQLTVALRATAPEPGRVTLERLVLAVSSSRKSHPCPPQAISCPSANGARTLYYRFPRQQWTNFGVNAIEEYQYGVILTVRDIPDVAPNLAQDGQDVATSLPPVSVLRYVYTAGQGAPAPTYFPTPPMINYGEQVTNGSDYTWQGTSPVDTEGFDHWVYASAGTALAALTPTFYVGTNESVQNWNTTLVLLAGVLLGVSGGTLVAAFTEAIRKERA
jgi:hypothetical protein